jgi:hypothetical protein
MRRSAKIIVLAGVLLLPLFLTRAPRVALVESGKTATHWQPQLQRGAAMEPLGPLPHDLKSQLSYAATLAFEERAALLQSVVEAVPENSFSDAFSALAATKNEEDLRMRLLQRWSEFNPQAAAEAVMLLPSEERSEAISRVATVWSRTSFADALVWARNLSEHREAGLLALANEASPRNPAQALELLGQIAPSKESEGILTRSITAWSDVDSSAATRWAENQKDPVIRSTALSAITTSLADRDPIAAAEMLITKTERSPAQENAIMGILQRFARKDVDAALKWASQFPEEIRGPALAEIQRISERQISRR